MDDETILQMRLTATKVPPKAANEIGDNNGNSDQTDDLVNVEQHILSYDFVVAIRTTTPNERLNQLSKSCHINQFDQHGQPCQSEQFCDRSRFIHKCLEWKH